MVTKEELKQLLKEGYSKGYNFHKDLSTANQAERVTDQETHIAIMLIKAKRTNTGYIYVGFDEGLKSDNGFELEATDYLPMPIDRADKIWILADTANDGVEIICLV